MQLTLAASWPCSRQGPLKLWHDVWQILQEIPAGLFNFLWTATKVLSPHIIIAGNGLWVRVYAQIECWFILGHRLPGPLWRWQAWALWLIIMMLVAAVPSAHLERCHSMSDDLWWRWQLRRWGHTDRDLNICHQTRTLTFYMRVSYFLKILETK